MNNEKIKIALERYISSDDQLGFQIDGGWGTGKTYFMKNHMIDKIKEYDFIPIYVSLNGVDGIQSLNEKIYNNLLSYSLNISPIVASRFLLIMKSGVINGINYIGNSNSKMSLIINFFKGVCKTKNNNKRIFKMIKDKNVVFIFDNFERITNDANIEELIGYMSDLLGNSTSQVKNLKNKMIIISNEINMNNENNKNTFFIEKEKIINKTIKFGHDTLGIAIEIVKHSINELKVDNEIKKYLINASVALLNIINTNHINLRILFSIISTFKDFYKEWIEKYNKNNSIDVQMLKTAFISIFILTHTLKRNKITNSDNLNKIFLKDSNTIMSDERLEKSWNNNGIKSGKNNVNKSSYEDLNSNYIYNKFHSKYNKYLSGNIMYSYEIWSLITNNYFNIKKYRTEIDDIFQFKFEKGSIYTNELANAIFLNEHELYELEKDVSNKCIDINLSLNNLLLIYVDMEYINSIDLLLYKFNFKKMKSIILKKINMLTSLDTLDSVELNKIRVSRINNKSFQNKISENIQCRKDKLYNNRDYKFIQGILKGDYSVYHKYINCFQNNSVFQILCKEKYLNIITNNNSSCIYLYRYLNHEVFKQSNIESVNFEYLDKFLYKLIILKNKIYDKVHYNNCNSIIDLIKRIKSNY